MKTKRKHKFGWYVRWSLSLAVVAASLGFFVLSLPVWKLSKVEIHGSNLISKGKIISVAQIPLEENTLLIDSKGIAQRLRSVIQIKNVRIFKKLPDTLVIEIEERAPFALLVTENRTVLIDDQGYIIATPGKASYFKVPDISRFPVIRGVKNKDLVEGKRLNFKDRVFISRSLKLLSKFIGPESLQIKIGNLDNIVVFVEDVLRLELGDIKRIEQKIEVFGAILKEIEGKWEKVDYIDVKIPDFPVVKYKT